MQGIGDSAGTAGRRSKTDIPAAPAGVAEALSNVVKFPGFPRRFLPIRLRGIHALRPRIARIKRGETIMRRVIRALRALRVDRRGSVAAFLGLAIIPLVAAVGLSVDAARGWLYKSRLGSALDSAALAGGRIYTDDNRDNEIEMLFRANLPNGFLDATVEPLQILPNDTDKKLIVTARAHIPTTFMRVVGINTMTVAATTEVTLESQNVEVALVLDVTGSMGDPTPGYTSKIVALREAANELVDIVVQDQQTPFYSKVALVPYSMGVNVGTYADSVRGTVTNNTCTYPAAPTCRTYRFPRQSDSQWVQPQDYYASNISTCVTERIGAQAYTDVAPNVAPVGKNFPTASTCLTSQILPLTSNKTTLHTRINGLTSGGNTAGQVGVAWGWYMVSPNWGYLWPAGGQPAAYGTPKLAKVVVIMTDGEYNSVHYNGVIAQDSTTGSGGANTHIKHNSHLHPETSYTQSKHLCDGMKAAGVIIYTVGLGVDSKPQAMDLLTNCATDATHMYLPVNGGSLVEAFRDIARKVSRLRLSK
jgi:Flp pilus assembly protein TadG